MSLRLVYSPDGSTTNDGVAHGHGVMLSFVGRG